VKFESKFGLGEIVNYLRRDYNGTIIHDELLEVVGINFFKDGTSYMVRGHHGVTLTFMESELEGDENFNKETGCYD